MEEASRLGKTPGCGERSRTVMVVDLGRSGLRARERAVLSPKTPAPTMRMLEGSGPFSLRGEGGFALVLKGDGEGLQGGMLEEGGERRRGNENRRKSEEKWELAAEEGNGGGRGRGRKKLGG